MTHLLSERLGDLRARAGGLAFGGEQTLLETVHVRDAARVDLLAQRRVLRGQLRLERRVLRVELRRRLGRVHERGRAVGELRGQLGARGLGVVGGALVSAERGWRQREGG
jgi:hypothetical protein